MKRILPNNLQFNTLDNLKSFISTTFGASTVQRLQRGITHVTLLHSHNNTYRTIKTHHQSPKHTFDTFMLNLARASADAIVITGETIRTEPQLTMRLFGPYRSILQQYRNTVCDKPQPADIIVLTRDSSKIDAQHPILHTEHRVKYYSTTQRAALYHCLQHYKSNYDSISIEAGPNTTLPLYQSVVAGECTDVSVDNLMLSLYSGRLPDGQLVSTRHSTEFVLNSSVVSRLFPHSQCTETELGDWQFCVRHK